MSRQFFEGFPDNVIYIEIELIKLNTMVKKIIKIGQEIRKLWLFKHTLNIKTKYRNSINSRLSPI